jgi:Domain of unknown function (DUF4157)
VTAERAVTHQPGPSGPATRAATVAPAIAPLPYRALGNRAVGRLLAAEGGPSASRALEPGLRTTLEARFGQDFESVRIYTGPAATSLAAAHRAKALTIGDDIVLRDGYAPSTEAGRRSLAHELAHVVQQRRSGPAAGELALESDAERTARAFVAHPASPILVHEASAVRVSRQADESGKPDDSPDWLDYVIQAVVQAATRGLGGPMPSLVAVALRGFVAEMLHQLSWTGRAKFYAELRHLEIGNFVAGYAAGAIAGLASPLTDLVGLLVLARHVPEAVAKVLVRGYQERAAILTDAEEIAKGIRDWLSNLGKDIGGLDAKTIQQLLDLLGERAIKAASSAGHQTARELVKTLTGGGDAAKESWVSGLFVGNKSRERGYNIGHTVGAVVSNALIFVFTEGVGDAIVQIGARLGKLGGLIGKSAELVVAIGEVVVGVERAIGAVLGTVLKPLEKLLKPLVELLGKLRSLLRRLLGVVEKGPAVAAAEAGAEALEKKLAPKPAAPAPAPKPTAARPAPESVAPSPAPAQRMRVATEPSPDIEDLAPESVAPSPAQRMQVATEPSAGVKDLAPELPPGVGSSKSPKPPARSRGAAASGVAEEFKVEEHAAGREPLIEKRPGTARPTSPASTAQQPARTTPSQPARGSTAEDIASVHDEATQGTGRGGRSPSDPEELNAPPDRLGVNEEDLEQMSPRYEGDRFDAAMTEEDLALVAQELFPQYAYDPAARGRLIFKAGKLTGRRSSGSTVPDLYLRGRRARAGNPRLAPISLEAKNYFLGGEALYEDFVATTVKQARQRAAALPKSAQQHLVIDLRGQNPPVGFIERLRADLVERSGGLLGAGRIHFLTAGTP